MQFCRSLLSGFEFPRRPWNYPEEPWTSSCGKHMTPHLPDTTKQAWLPLLLVVHSVPKYHPHVTPQGMRCPSSLCCEYIWLMNCYRLHLSSARCPMLGHPHTLRVGIPPLPMGLRGGDSGTLNSSCPKKLEAWLLCSHCAKSCFLEPMRNWDHYPHLLN